MKSQGNCEKKRDCCPLQKQIKNKSSRGIWKFSLTGTRGHAHLFTHCVLTGTQSAWPLPTCKCTSVKTSCSYSKRWSGTQSFRTTWILGAAGRKVQFSSPTMDCGTRDYMYVVGCFKYTMSNLSTTNLRSRYFYINFIEEEMNLDRLSSFSNIF